MKWNGTMRFAWPLILLVLVMAFAAPPAEAQLYRILGISEEGEPTDPDETVRQLDEFGIDLEGNGISKTVPTTEAEQTTWWEAILDLLREMGLLEEDKD